VTTSPGFEDGDDLYLVYRDEDGVESLPHGGASPDANSDGAPSETTPIDNPPETPEVVAVNRTGAANDVIDVDWDDDDLGGPGDDITQVSQPDNYEVYDANNNTLVATGEATDPSQGNSTPGGCDPCTVEVDLDTDLTPGTDYTLRVAEDTVQDPNNNPNEAQTASFTFAGQSAPTVVDDAGQNSVEVNGTHVPHNGQILLNTTSVNMDGLAEDTDGTIADVEYQIDGGSFTSANATDGAFDSASERFDFSETGSDGRQVFGIRATDDDGATGARPNNPTYDITVDIDTTAPSVQSIETDPANERLVVAFSEPVDCADTPADWSFNNNSTRSLDGSEASGQPSDVDDSSSVGNLAQNECGLSYTSGDVEVDDFGDLDYTGSSVTEQFGDNTAASNFSGEDVVDSVAPKIDGIVPHHPSDEIRLDLSEPIDCTTLGPADLNVTINNGASTTYSVTSCNDPDMNPVITTTGDIAEDGDVSVEVVTTNIQDESGDNNIASGDSSTVPAYVNLELSGTSTSLGTVSACDDCGETVTMPFSVTLFGQSSDELEVSSNGFAEFGPPSPTNSDEFDNEAFPTTEIEHALAPFWDDLAPGAEGTVYTDTIGTGPNREFVIQWDQTADIGDSESGVTFQVVIHENGDPVEFRYFDTKFGVDDTGQNDGGSATIGTNDGDGSTADQHSFETKSVSDGDVLTFTP
jgi:hypothetical protein